MKKLPFKINLKNKKLSFFLKFVAFFLTLSILYAGLAIAPAVSSSKSLSRYKKLLKKPHTLLSQNKVSLSQIIALDPDTPDYQERKSAIVDSLKKTNEEGRQLNLDNNKLPKAKGKKATKNFLINEAYPALSDLYPKTSGFFREQKPLIDKIILLNEALDNVYAYDPIQDLETPDLVEDRQQIIERSARASQGIEEIVNQLESFEEDGAEELIQSLAGSKNRLEGLQEALEAENFEQAGQMRLSFINEFSLAKERAQQLEREVLTGQEAVSLLTRQTNLILEYELWLERATDRQEKIETNPLSAFLAGVSATKVKE